MEIEPRPLSDTERDVLDLLLTPHIDGADALREQAEGAVVVGRCACGCPTIHLAASPGTPRAAVSSRLWPIEGLVDNEGEQPPIQIILLVDDGQLSSLELVYYTPSPPVDWPPIERIRVS